MWTIITPRPGVFSGAPRLRTVLAVLVGIALLVFLIRHSGLQDPTVFNMPAFYSQLSKKVRQFGPFVRYQYVNANPRSVFEDVRLRHGPSFGSRYDFNDYVAFTAQLDHTLRKGQPDLNGLQLQFAFTF